MPSACFNGVVPPAPSAYVVGYPGTTYPDNKIIAPAGRYGVSDAITAGLWYEVGSEVGIGGLFVPDCGLGAVAGVDNGVVGQ